MAITERNLAWPRPFRNAADAKQQQQQQQQIQVLPALAAFDLMITHTDVSLSPNYEPKFDTLCSKSIKTLMMIDHLHCITTLR